jgi:hypothetical protein
MSMFQAQKARADELHAAVMSTGAALNAFTSLHPKGPIGLTPDHVRAMPEFVKLKSEYERAAAASRAFNAIYVKKFAKEIRAARSERLREMTAALQS